MKKIFGYIIRFLGIGIVVWNVISMFSLRFQNWEMHNLAFLLNCFGDILVCLFCIFIGLVLSFLGVVTSEI